MSLSGRIGEHYEIVTLLGSGAMGEVYRAVDRKMFDRTVAIKFLSERLTDSEEGRARFRREVETSSRLHHPNIVTIYDWGEHQGRDFFVMEFVDGRDLQALLMTGISWDLEQRLEVAFQVADALDFAHRAGVIHRDIKPGNVMVVRSDSGPRVKLVDFGIAHVERSTLTQMQSHPGTISYMSPEQLRSEELDSRSDIFSLGIVLFELFSGHHPFEAKSEAMISSRLLRDDPDPASRHGVDLPLELESLILSMLEKDPVRRPGTARGVADALRDLSRKAVARSVSADPSITGRGPHDPHLAPLEPRLAELETVPPEVPEREKFVVPRMKEVTSLLGAGKIEESLALLSTILRKYPDQTDATVMLDRVIAVAAAHGDYRVAVQAAWAALHVGDLEAASTSCERATMLWPDGPEVQALVLEISTAKDAARRRAEDLEAARRREEEAAGVRLQQRDDSRRQAAADFWDAVRRGAFDEARQIIDLWPDGPEERSLDLGERLARWEELRLCAERLLGGALDAETARKIRLFTAELESETPDGFEQSARVLAERLNEWSARLIDHILHVMELARTVHDELKASAARAAERAEIAELDDAKAAKAFVTVFDELSARIQETVELVGQSPHDIERLLDLNVKVSDLVKRAQSARRAWWPHEDLPASAIEVRKSQQDTVAPSSLRSGAARHEIRKFAWAVSQAKRRIEDLFANGTWLAWRKWVVPTLSLLIAVAVVGATVWWWDHRVGVETRGGDITRQATRNPAGGSRAGPNPQIDAARTQARVQLQDAQRTYHGNAMQIRSGIDSCDTGLKWIDQVLSRFPSDVDAGGVKRSLGSVKQDLVSQLKMLEQSVNESLDTAQGKIRDATVVPNDNVADLRVKREICDGARVLLNDARARDPQNSRANALAQRLTTTVESIQKRFDSIGHESSPIGNAKQGDSAPQREPPMPAVPTSLKGDRQPEVVQPKQGSLFVDAVPWGRVMRVIEADRNDTIATADNLVTPCTLNIPIGHYKVTVQHEIFGTVIKEIELTAGPPYELRLGLPRFDPGKAAASLLGLPPSTHTPATPTICTEPSDCAGPYLWRACYKSAECRLTEGDYGKALEILKKLTSTEGVDDSKQKPGKGNDVYAYYPHFLKARALLGLSLFDQSRTEALNSEAPGKSSLLRQISLTQAYQERFEGRPDAGSAVLEAWISQNGNDGIMRLVLASFYFSAYKARGDEAKRIAAKELVLAAPRDVANISSSHFSPRFLSFVEEVRASSAN